MTTGTGTGAAAALLALLSLPPPATAEGFSFVSVSAGHLPEPLSGHGFDSVSAANDGSDIVWACSRSGSLEGYSVAREGSSSDMTAVYLSGPGKVPGCSSLTFLHGPSCADGTHICNNTSPLVPNITGLVAATNAGLVAYRIGPGGTSGRLELTRSSKVSPTAGAVTAVRPFRHFKSSTPGQLDPDALIVGASSVGELFAADVSTNGSLDVASGAFPVSKLANVSTGGTTPTVGGFARWDFMGISMYLGVTLSSGPIVLNALQISGHDNLEPQDPSSWGEPHGLPEQAAGVRAPAGFPDESGCGDTVEHNDLICECRASFSTSSGENCAGIACRLCSIVFHSSATYLTVVRWFVLWWRRQTSRARARMPCWLSASSPRQTPSSTSPSPASTPKGCSSY